MAGRGRASFTLPQDIVGALMTKDLKAPIAGAESGPLAGRSFVVKDQFAVEGCRISYGNPAYLAAAEPAARTSPAVRRLLDAGATLVGIGICDEFFYSLLGTNAHFGSPRNPRAPGRVTGGSSTGAAAAVAAGLCDFSLGSDTGGSVRVPAAFCGLFGIRPTHGRIDLSLAAAMAPSYDTGGWFADDADLFRAIGPVLLEGEGRAAPVERMLIATDAFERAVPSVKAVLEGALARLAPAIAPTSQVDVAGGRLETWRDAFRVLQAGEIQTTYLPWIEEHRPPLGPGIRERVAMAAAITAQEIGAAREVREAVRARMGTLLPEGTVLVLPAAPTLPPTMDAGHEELETFRARTMALTCIAGHAGLPQVSIPAGLAEGCPVGLSLMGWPGSDEVLLELAQTAARALSRA